MCSNYLCSEYPVAMFLVLRKGFYLESSDPQNLHQCWPVTHWDTEKNLRFLATNFWLFITWTILHISLLSRLGIRSLDQAECPAGDVSNTFSGISNKICVLRVKVPQDTNAKFTYQ